MNWQDLAGPLVKLGAPTIGTALGGPLGGMIGGAVGDILGSVLGVPPTPEAVDKAIRTTPASELQEKLAAAGSPVSWRENGRTTARGPRRAFPKRLRSRPSRRSRLDGWPAARAAGD